MSRIDENNVEADRFIAAKVKESRLLTGLSKQQLATLINVTHQQLDKYERGANRLSGGRIVSIARALSKPIAFFFDGIDGLSVEENENDRFIMLLAREGRKISNRMQRQAILDIMKTMNKGK